VTSQARPKARAAAAGWFMELNPPAVAQKDAREARRGSRSDLGALAATLPPALTVDEAARLLRVKRVRHSTRRPGSDSVHSGD